MEFRCFWLTRRSLLSRCVAVFMAWPQYRYKILFWHYACGGTTQLSGQSLFPGKVISLLMVLVLQDTPDLRRQYGLEPVQSVILPDLLPWSMQYSNCWTVHYQTSPLKHTRRVSQCFMISVICLFTLLFGYHRTHQLLFLSSHFALKKDMRILPLPVHYLLFRTYIECITLLIHCSVCR